MNTTEHNQVDISMHYIFPTDLVGKSYGGFLLLISQNNGNWIVLNNNAQVQIVKLLQRGLSPKDILETHTECSQEDVFSVITELNGKHFCEKMLAEENEFTLRIYLTNRCNLRCKHCFMYASDELDGELTYEEIIQLIDDSKLGGCSKVIFTGGEVVLKSRFIEILKHAKALGLYVQVLTNGVLWTDQLVDDASYYIDEIQVSIDGYDEESNARIRGNGVFSKAIKTVERFVQKETVFVSIITTPLYDLLEDKKTEYIEFGKNMIARFGTEHFLIIFAKELIDGRTVKADVERNRRMTEVVDEIYEKIYPNSELTTFVVNHRCNRIYLNCGYGGLTVNSNGDFFFCGRVFEVTCYGNIREMPFEDVLKKRKAARELSYVHNILPCRDCSIRYICGGGCRIANIPAVTSADLNAKHKFFTRECSEEYKNNIYKLMIEANEYLYW